MKPKVDKDTCIACGLCPSICPECFDMEDDGKAGAIVDEVPDGFYRFSKRSRRKLSCRCNLYRRIEYKNRIDSCIKQVSILFFISI